LKLLTDKRQTFPSADKSHQHPDEGFEMADVFPNVVELTKNCRTNIIEVRHVFHSFLLNEIYTTGTTPSSFVSQSERRV